MTAAGADVRAALARVRRADERLRAVIRLLDDQALDAARALDAGAAPPGPLGGMAVAVKDNIDVRGVPTTNGRPDGEHAAAPADGTIVARVRAAGGIVLAKTNMAELGLGATTQNRHWGECANPWDTTRIPGGSSGGSAVAVAAGYCPLALGTDTGGSGRNPAAFCGIVGFRPTAGRLPLDGVTPVSPVFDVPVPMARDADGVAALFAVLDGAAPPQAGGDALQGLRVGVPRPYFFEEVDAVVARAVEAALRILREAGARAENIMLPSAGEARAAVAALINAHAADQHRAALDREPARFDPEVRERLLMGRVVAPADLARAESVRRRWEQEVAAAFERVDVLVVPTVPVPAPPRRGASMIATSLAVNRLTSPWSLAGVPALSLPCGFSPDGLPLAAQLVGPRGADWRVLDVARAYQRLTRWHLARPPDVAPGGSGGLP